MPAPPRIIHYGPPLSSVAEKSRHCLEGLDVATRGMRTAAQAETDRDDLVGFQAKYAFHSAVVGYLALHDMLALANEHNITERLLRYSRDDFTEWLDRIDAGGSVTG